MRKALLSEISEMLKLAADFQESLAARNFKKNQQAQLAMMDYVRSIWENDGHTMASMQRVSVLGNALLQCKTIDEIKNILKEA